MKTSAWVVLMSTLLACGCSGHETHSAETWTVDIRRVPSQESPRRRTCESSGSTAFVGADGSVLSASASWNEGALSQIGGLTLEDQTTHECRKLRLPMLNDGTQLIDALGSPTGESWMLLLSGLGEPVGVRSNWTSGSWALVWMQVSDLHTVVIDEGDGIFPVLNSDHEQFSYFTSDASRGGDARVGHIATVRSWDNPVEVVETVGEVWGAWADGNRLLVLRDPNGSRCGEILVRGRSEGVVATGVVGPNAISHVEGWVLFFSDAGKLILRRESSQTEIDLTPEGGIRHVGGMQRVDHGFTWSTENHSYLLVLDGHRWNYVTLDSETSSDSTTLRKTDVKSAYGFVMWYEGESDAQLASAYFDPRGYFVESVSNLVKKSVLVNTRHIG